MIGSSRHRGIARGVRCAALALIALAVAPAAGAAAGGKARVQLLTPAPGEEIRTAGLQPVPLRWQPQQNAALYEVEIARDAELTKLVSQRTVSSPELEVVVPPGMRLWWRVRALQGSGSAGAWSDARWFTLVVEETSGSPPPVPSPVPQAAAADAPASPDVEETASIAPAERLALHLGPRVGFLYNFGQVATARGDLELGYRLPVLESYLGFALSVGYYTAAVEAAGEGGEVELAARLHAVPVALVGTWVLTTDIVDLYAGAGPCLDAGVVTIQLADAPEIQQPILVFGGVAVAGAERMLGPGALFVDLRLTLTTQTSGRVETTPASLNAGLGYRFKIW